MQRKSWLLLTVLTLVVGIGIGWLCGSWIASKENERHAADVASLARFVQAKEGALLVQLLEERQLIKGRDLVYTMLIPDFNYYVNSDQRKEQERMCELVKLLGPNFFTHPTESSAPKSRATLVEIARAATNQCVGVVK